MPKPSNTAASTAATGIDGVHPLTAECLDKISGFITRHEEELREQGIYLEGQRHDFQAVRDEVRRHTEMLGTLETALQQSRGVWRAAVVVAGMVSAVVTVVGMWVGR